LALAQGAPDRDAVGRSRQHEAVLVVLQLREVLLLLRHRDLGALVLDAPRLGRHRRRELRAVELERRPLLRRLEVVLLAGQVLRPPPRVADLLRAEPEARPLELAPRALEDDVLRLLG